MKRRFGISVDTFFDVPEKTVFDWAASCLAVQHVNSAESTKSSTKSRVRSLKLFAKEFVSRLTEKVPRPSSLQTAMTNLVATITKMRKNVEEVKARTVATLLPTMVVVHIVSDWIDSLAA
jgi:hypothetical protein